MNPYYDAEKLDLEMYALDEPDMSYEYNTLDFWTTKDGRVFVAQDSGCSCPTPFEDYEGDSQEAVLLKLERAGSAEQAVAAFKAWNSSINHHSRLPMEEAHKLEAWVQQKLKT